MLQWIDIKPASGGFGEYEASGKGDLFDTLTELLSDCDAIEIEDGAELPEGAEDIRGLVRNEPDRIFVCVAPDGYVSYFGVNEVDDESANQPHNREQQ